MRGDFLIAESFIISIILGFIRGGKLKRLSKIKFKAVWTFIIALIMQIIIVFSIEFNVNIIVDYMEELHIFSYIIFFIGILVNIKYKSLWLITLGGMVNLFLLINKGEKATIVLDVLKLKGLDKIVIHRLYPYPRIIGIGDIIIALGLFIFIQSIMLNKKLDRNRKPIFKYKSRYRI